MTAQRLLWGALRASYGCSEAAHGVHMAAQRLLWGALGVAYGCPEAPYGCPWGCIWLFRGCISMQRGCILLHRSCLWLPRGRYAVYAASGWARLGSQDPDNMARPWFLGGLLPLTDSWRWRLTTAKCINQGSRLKNAHQPKADGLTNCLNERWRL